MSGATAGIVITGTEILTGRITDRNGPWLTEQLRAHGFEVRHITICRDREEDILTQLDFMHREGMDLVCTTGGLGPTADDMTTALVARFCEREIFLDEPLLEQIRAIVRPYAERFGWELSAIDEGAVKQAHVPREAAVLGPAGTAPGLVVTPAQGSGKPTVVVLPGPPGEMRSIWAEAVETPEFRRVAAAGSVPEEQMLRMIGVPEPDIARTLREFDADQGLGELEVTTCLRGGEMEILISHQPAERERREALVRKFEQSYGGAIFSRDGETVDQQVVRLLAGRGLALAESCTGGLLAKRLTDVDGASEFFLGSAVTYSNEAKERLLGVSRSTIENCGAVSAEVAAEMAEGALERFGADFAVSTTGVAGPTGGTEEKPVGTLYVHVAARDGRSNPLHIVLPGRRDDVRQRAAMVALHLLRALLSD